MRIGILGGTFDPPHIGHLLMAEEARVQMKLDEIWWMPNRIPPHKEQDSETTVDQRILMVKKMTELHRNFKLCDIEVRREGPSYTVDTMSELKNLYPSNDFYFIIGEDSLKTLFTWYKSEELLSLVSFIVIRRPGYEVHENPDKNRITIIDGATINVSSSEIRDMIKENKLNQFLLHKDVHSIIKEYHLYE